MHHIVIGLSMNAHMHESMFKMAAQSIFKTSSFVVNDQWWQNIHLDEVLFLLQ